jgi:beta-phosphoglucomutase
MIKLKISLTDTIVFEDSIAKIQAAKNANAGKIIVVNSNDEEYSFNDQETITSFKNFDYSYI